MEKEKGGSSTGGGSGAGIPASKAYSSHLAVQTDAAKYRGKYKELKKKVWQIEKENDKLHFKTLRIKRNIQRMRLERAILYERLEAEIGESSAMADVIDREAAGVGHERIAADDAHSLAHHHAHHSHHQQQHSQHLAATAAAVGQSASTTTSTPSNRRVIDYSPSPEEGKSPSESVPPPAATSNGEPRQGMKVTLKRNSNANGKEPAW